MVGNIPTLPNPVQAGFVSASKEQALPAPRYLKYMVRLPTSQAERCGKLTLVLGGVRSGKSRYAEALGAGLGRVVFVATATAGDEDMRAKIARHRAGRPADWTTVEEPLRMRDALARAGKADLVIVDCLTLWASNALHAAGEDRAALARQINDLCAGLGECASPVVLVSNEVGSGIVPDHPLGRRFRDVLGEVNQRVAALADEVVLLVAGLPLFLKRAGA